jgi:hypothetical protein
MERPTGQDERPGGAAPEALPEPPPLSPEARRRQIVHLVVLDIAILAELAVALYFADAHRDHWDFTLTFCIVFFGLVIPTFLLSRWLMGKVGGG